MKYMIQQQKKTARARGDNVQVSTKTCIEICSFLRGKLLDKGIAILERVLEEKEAIPYKRFNDGVGHRPGMAAGRYPVKATAEVLSLLESVKSNAETLGLTGTLKITHIAAQKASSPMRSRLKYRAEFKRTHLEVVVAEVKTPEKKAKATPAKAPEETKSSEKKEESPKPVEKKEAPVEKTPEVKKETSPTPKPVETAVVEKKEAVPAKVPEVKKEVPVKTEEKHTPKAPPKEVAEVMEKLQKATPKPQDSKSEVKSEEKSHGN